jgi:hypothetical protein
MQTIKIYLLIAILLFSCKSENNKIEYKSGNWTFNECITPINGVIFSNYIIILNNRTDLRYFSNINHKDSSLFSENSKIFVLNYLTNEIDTVFRNKISKKGISELYVKNDSLYAYDANEKKWLRWNDKWEKKTPFNNNYYKKFEKSYLHKKCRLIFEDDKYYIFSYDRGEFGAGVVFLNKVNGLVYGYPMTNPMYVFKDTLGYIVAGNSTWDIPMSNLLRIKYPERLPVIPENRIIFDYNTEKNYYYNQEYLAMYLYDEVLLKLPDSLKIKLHSIQKNIKDFNKRRDPDFNKRIVFDKQIDSLFKYDKNVEYLIDNSRWYKNDKTLCYGTFWYENKLLHILGDSMLYLAKVTSSGTNKIQDTVISNNLKTNNFITSMQSKDKVLIIVNSTYRIDTCGIVSCFVIDNMYIKRYDFK